MEGFALIICKYYAILYTELEYGLDFGISGGPATNLPGTPWDNYSLSPL
jgi:hypothetical protein